jgi:hypothetical protein
MREILYHRQEDKKKFNDICWKIKVKIENFGRRDCLPSIFTSDTFLQKYLDRFFNERGVPNFRYRDDYQRQVKGMWDKIYFFYKGTNVDVFMIQGGVEIIKSGITNYVDVNNNQVKIIVDGVEVIADFYDIRRNFDSELLNTFVLDYLN